MTIQISQNNIPREDGKDFNIMSLLNKDISFSKELPLKKKERFYSELHVLLSSGVDIKTALDIIVEEQQKKNDIELFSSIAEKVLRGMSLSEALQHTGKFTPYEYFSIEIGEESGRIVAVLEELASYFNRRITQKRKLVNSFSYPLMVLCIALAAVVFLLNFLVPMFADVFTRFGAELPALTQAVLNISDFMKAYIGLFFLFIIMIVSVLLVIRKRPAFKRISSRMLISIPVIGKLLRLSYLERFFGTMALLLSSRTPVMRSIALTKQMISFYVFQEELGNIEKHILAGVPLHKGMEDSLFFDKRTVALVKVAEEVNRLDSIFGKLNAQIADELEHKMGMLSNFMEPILIIFVGILVAVILIAMYLPMFQLSSAIY